MQIKNPIAFVSIFAVMITAGMVLNAQGGVQDMDMKGIVFKNEVAFDFRLHTNGMAIALNLGEIQTYYRTKYYHFELGFLRDPREQSQNRNLLQRGRLSNSFIFGKQNSLMVLRAGVGRRILLSEKAKRKGVAVGYNYQIGPALALVKPYYLDLIYQQERDGRIDLNIQSESFNDQNRDKFTTFNDIFGSSGFSKGLTEMSFVPGIQGKFAMFFSLGAFDKYIRTVETGIMTDLFIRKIPIMIETPEISNKPYFINLYANIRIGYRTN
jgi:hypothetical protein